MAVPTAAKVGESWPQHREREIIEFWELTGDTSIAGDTVAITPRFGHIPLLALGAVSYTISGSVITVKLLAALAAAQVIAIEIVMVPGAN